MATEPDKTAGKCLSKYVKKGVEDKHVVGELGGFEKIKFVNTWSFCYRDAGGTRLVRQTGEGSRRRVSTSKVHHCSIYLLHINLVHAATTFTHAMKVASAFTTCCETLEQMRKI